MATLNIYVSGLRYCLDGTVDWDTDVIKCAFLSVSAASAITTARTFADVSAYEITTNGGYPAGGVTLTGASVGEDGNSVVLNLDDKVVAAVGGDIDAHRYYYIYKSGTTNSVTNPGVLYGYDNLGSDVPATIDGTSITLRWNSGGVWTGAVA